MVWKINESGVRREKSGCVGAKGVSDVSPGPRHYLTIQHILRLRARDTQILSSNYNFNDCNKMFVPLAVNAVEVTSSNRRLSFRN